MEENENFSLKIKERIAKREEFIKMYLTEQSK